MGNLDSGAILVEEIDDQLWDRYRPDIVDSLSVVENMVVCYPELRIPVADESLLFDKVQPLAASSAHASVHFVGRRTLVDGQPDITVLSLHSEVMSVLPPIYGHL